MLAAVLLALALALPVSEARADGPWFLLKGFVGDSMAPAYHTGDVVLVVPTDPSTLQVGQDIAYWPCGVVGPTALVHRVVAVGEDAQGRYLVAQGVANDAPDWCWLTAFQFPYRVRAADVIGVAVNVSP